MKNTFWQNWEYDEDWAMWRNYIEKQETSYYSPLSVEKLPETFTENFVHHCNFKNLLKKAWEIIRSLPVHEVEKGRQYWEVVYLQIVPEDVNKIRAAFYEHNFDIYRETHILLKLENDNYKFIDIIYEIA